MLHVLPDVELGPVRQREDAKVLARSLAAVVQVPELRPLVLRVPLSEVVAVREDPLLGARLLLVAPRAADRGIEAELLDRVEQRDGLQRVAAGVGPVSSFTRPWSIESWTRRTINVQSMSATNRSRNVSVSGKLWPVSMCSNGKGHARGRKRLARQPRGDDRVLAAGEQQRGSFELGGDLAQNVDGFVFEVRQRPRGRAWLF